MDTKPLSILDIEFPCSMPYAAGHVLNEPEAKVLNQTRRENLSNNFRTEVRKHVESAEGAKTLEELQSAFAELDAKYVFTISNAGTSRKFTPEEREARRIAREYVKAELDKQGLKIGVAPEGTSESDWEDIIEQNIETIAADDAVVKMAKDIVKAKSKASGLQLAGLGLQKADEAPAA